MPRFPGMYTPTYPSPYTYPQQPTRASSDYTIPSAHEQVVSDWMAVHQQDQTFSSNKKGFSFLRAGTQFVKGLFQPIKKMIEHPLKSLALIGGAAFLSTMFPIVTPLLFAGGMLMGGYQVTKGIYNAVSHYASGNMRESENSFYDIGGGTSTLGITALGGKRASKIAAEGKAATLGADVSAAGKATESLGFFGRTKEVFSLFTSKEGWGAIGGGMKDMGQWLNKYDGLSSLIGNAAGALFPQVGAIIPLVLRVLSGAASGQGGIGMMPQMPIANCPGPPTGMPGLGGPHHQRQQHQRFSVMY